MSFSTVLDAESRAGKWCGDDPRTQAWRLFLPTPSPPTPETHYQERRQDPLSNQGSLGLGLGFHWKVNPRADHTGSRLQINASGQKIIIITELVGEGEPRACDFLVLPRTPERVLFQLYSQQEGRPPTTCPVRVPWVSVTKSPVAAAKGPCLHHFLYPRETTQLCFLTLYLFLK